MVVPILTNAERVARTFAHESVDQLAFSPRLYYWYWGNFKYLFAAPAFRGWARRFRRSPVPIPPQYWRKTQRQVYDYLGAAIRYALETLYVPVFWTFGVDVPRWGPRNGHVKVRTTRGRTPTETIRFFQTPRGTLRDATDRGAGMGGHKTEYLVKHVADLDVLEYILDHARFHFSRPLFAVARRLLGSRGVPCQYLPHSPYQRCVLDLLGFERTIIFLRRYPARMHAFLEFLERNDDAMFARLARSPMKHLNFGENLDARLAPPRYFERYLLPHYQERVSQLHRAGKVCHVHVDGAIHDLLPYFRDLPFDGLEALTPHPQGDATLAEIHAAMGDEQILLDGIPAILFLPQYSLRPLEKCVEELLERFAPRLVVGVSDELPPNGDIRKVEVVGRMVREFRPN